MPSYTFEQLHERAKKDAVSDKPMQIPSVEFRLKTEYCERGRVTVTYRDGSSYYFVPSRFVRLVRGGLEVDKAFRRTGEEHETMLTVQETNNPTELESVAAAYFFEALNSFLSGRQW